MLGRYPNFSNEMIHDLLVGSLPQLRRQLIYLFLLSSLSGRTYDIGSSPKAYAKQFRWFLNLSILYIYKNVTAKKFLWNFIQQEFSEFWMQRRLNSSCTCTCTKEETKQVKLIKMTSPLNEDKAKGDRDRHKIPANSLQKFVTSEQKLVFKQNIHNQSCFLSLSLSLSLCLEFFLFPMSFQNLISIYSSQLRKWNKQFF